MEKIFDNIVNLKNVFTKTKPAVYQLSKTETNLIYIPVGNMPKYRVDVYLKKISDELNEKNHPHVLIPVSKFKLNR